jgi:hypothetical protein
MKYFTLAVCLCLISLNISGQAKMRKLSSSINHPSINLYAPYISADANAMVFISDNAEDGVLTPFYTFREATDWKEPLMLPKQIHTKLNFLRGYGLSADGKRIYFSTFKAPSVGGQDIQYSDWKGTAWSEPVNPGLPINTKAHEACASFTPDGNTIYFMRCQKMEQNKAESCKILRSTKKPNGQWEEPVELPSSINRGNSQTPRIMADGETLYFSSDKLTPNKGGMDLYVTRFQNNTWSNPVPLDFTNTEKDDQFISVAALGRYLLKDTQGQRKNELVEYLIPDEVRPKGMMKIEGKVTALTGNSIPAYVAAFDLTNNKRVFTGKPFADGSFFLYLKEGSVYELSIDPEQNNVSYYSKLLDLTSDKIPQVEKVTATLKPLTSGDELSLDVIKFKPHSSVLDVTANSANEMKRIVRAINGSTDLKFNVHVMLNGYEEDTIQSNPDLTEVIYDSIVNQYEVVDSLGQVSRKDTLMVKTTYHNDRTLLQAQAIIEHLASLGANRDKLTFFVNAIPATLPENRKLTIKAVAMK